MCFKITLTEVGVKACGLKLNYLQTVQAILRIIEMIFGFVMISVVAYYITDGQRITGDIFFLLVIVNFVICISCLLLSEWVVYSAVKAIPKSMFELVFFVVSVILITVSSVNLFANSVGLSHDSGGVYMAYVVMAIFGILSAVLYSIDVIFNLCLDCCHKKKPDASEKASRRASGNAFDTEQFSSA